MLAVRLTTYAVKSMSLYDTLETLAFGCTHDVNLIAFGKNVNGNGFTNIFFNGKIAELFHEFFGRGACFGEMICFRFVGVLLIFIAKCKLESIVTIAVLGSYLCNHTRTCFDDCTGSLLACWIEDTGHPDFFSDDTFHFLTVFPARLYKTDHQNRSSILVYRRPFPFTAAAP